MIEEESRIFEYLHSSVIARFELNSRGRDFVVGDIHGMFPHLRVLLEDIKFDPATDRVFSVGDLVDRGACSREALDWLELPWFFSCRGNHEQLAVDSEDSEILEAWVQYNGGGWWLELNSCNREQFRRYFGNLPLAMEVETASGVVGIVHADVPPLTSWDRFLQLLELKTRDAALYAMWSRNRIQGSVSNKPVTGAVDRIYCGHTPVREVVSLGNVHHIDTGAPFSYEGYDDARLTLVEIHPRSHEIYAINTNRSVTTRGTVPIAAFAREAPAAP